MVKLMSVTGNGHNNIEEISISYDESNSSDKRIIDEIMKLLDSQPKCYNYTSFELEGALGGYLVSCCKIFGCLEFFDNPHHDMDGSKCEHYKTKRKW